MKTRHVCATGLFLLSMLVPPSRSASPSEPALSSSVQMSAVQSWPSSSIARFQYSGDCWMDVHPTIHQWERACGKPSGTNGCSVRILFVDGSMQSFHAECASTLSIFETGGSVYVIP